MASLGSVTLPAQSAPGDALLSALPAVRTGSAFALPALGGEVPRLDLELDRDIANDRVDVLGLRDRSAYAGTAVGDYHGNHWRALLGWGAWQGEFTRWRRALQDRGDTHQLRSWQGAVQVRLGAGDAGSSAQGAWALRASGWGNSAPLLTRRTAGSLNVEGLSAELTDLQIRRARDRQWQLDLIGSRQALGLRWSGFAGAGTSRVRNDGVAARSTVAGCSYHLDFGRERLVATPDAGCQDALTFVIPNRVLPYDAQAETTYRARFAHLGGSARWTEGDWTLALGYEYQRWRREGIDALVASRGGAVYDLNHTLIGELGWSPLAGMQWLLRGQYMQHQWLGELPLAYNTLTASRFSQRYGFVSAGLRVTF